MKKFCLMLLAVMSISVMVFSSGCMEETKTTNDVSQIFERIISGDQIAQYIPFGSEGLICEYEYVEHVYHYGDSKAYLSIFRTAFIYETEEAASKRFTSLKRTYKDDAMQVGNVLLVNQNFINTDVGTITGGQRTWDELFDFMAEQDYILIEPDKPGRM